ncbi:hypothetical protein TNCV_4688061 [Trichonephila clavipes]|nr:hypothetical protein TNCV_4688061 [Trichonephila clavipes]
MDWPARSPDLNPIEHVWDFLGRRLAARTLPPVTIRELRLALARRMGMQKIQHPPLPRMQRVMITKLPFNFATGYEIYDLHFGS